MSRNCAHPRLSVCVRVKYVDISNMCGVCLCGVSTGEGVQVACARACMM